MRGLALFLVLLPGLALAQIEYTLTPEPAAQSIRVKATLEAKTGETEFRIPAWCPGYYVLQDYQKKISDVKVTDAQGRILATSSSDPRSWKVAAPAGTKLTLSYRVLGDDGGLGFFAVAVKPHTVFINGPAAFIYVVDRFMEAVQVRFNLPPKWEVATAMDPSGPGVWTAEGYDELLDHPIQLGLFERRKFEVEGLPFEAVFVSEDLKVQANPEEEARQLAQLSVPAIRMMGGAPFKRYLYLIHLAIGDFSGGLEHRASTVLAVPNMAKLRLNELATHEFYHVWNVKHIRPAVLGPFDYTKKVRTRNLWFSEGVTDYYAHVHAYQSGLRTAQDMLQGFTDQIAELDASRTRKSKTLEDAGLEAWENGSIGTGDLSYYTKGSVAGLVFDAAIRAQTGGKKSLDDVMRLLFSRHRLPKPGFEEDGLRKAINEVAGADLSELYRKVVQSTEDMPYEGLRALGLRVRKPGDGSRDLGFRLDQDRVAELDEDLRGQGLQKGDRIVSVGESRFGLGCFAPLAKAEEYTLAVSRSGGEKRLRLRVRLAKTTGLTLEFDPFAAAEAEQRREEWLKR